MSDSFLSQEEVDALLEGVTGERQKSDIEDVDESSVRNYDISSQERIVRGAYAHHGNCERAICPQFPYWSV